MNGPCHKTLECVDIGSHLGVLLNLVVQYLSYTALTGVSKWVLTVGSAGNFMHLVTSGGQHHLISQPAQVAVFSSANTHAATPSSTPSEIQLPLNASQGTAASPFKTTVTDLIFSG